MILSSRDAPIDGWVGACGVKDRGKGRGHREFITNLIEGICVVSEGRQEVKKRPTRTT
jgi:hypothetical protein